ncbi:MAG: hypothetical protein RR893_12680 [Clostridia bacterium]
MRFLSLLRFQYSKYGVKELFMMLLTGFIVLALMDAMSPILYTLTVTNLASDSLPTNTVYFYPFDRMTRILAGLEGDARAKDEVAAYLEEATMHHKALGVGKTYLIESAYGPADAAIRYVGYNEDMVKFTTIPLLRGQWIDTNTALGEIPIVVGGAFRDQEGVDVGDVIPLDFAAEGDGVYPCRVVGILNRNDMYFDLAFGESDPTVYSIAQLYQWKDNTYNDGTDYIVVYPTKYFDERLKIDYSPGRLLFFSHDAQVSELNQGKRYGTYATLDEMIETQIKRNLHFNNGHIVTAIALFLFCLMGLGGYALLNNIRHNRMMAIYRICGMRRSYGIFLQILSLTLLVVVPAGISLCLLPRRLDNFAMLNGTLYAMFAIVLLTIWLPPIILIATGYGSSFDVRKE